MTAPPVETITIRENKPDPGDHESLTVTRDATGQIREVVWREESDEPDPQRYQPVRWSETTYRWRPRLQCWDCVSRANDLYPGKPDHVRRDRVDALPAVLVDLLEKGKR